MNIILWDGLCREDLLPFTFARPAGTIRCGILTIEEKYNRLITGSHISHLSSDYLLEKFPITVEAENFLVNAAVLADTEFIESLKTLKAGQSLWKDGLFLAGNYNEVQVKGLIKGQVELPTSGTTEYKTGVTYLRKIWDIFSLNDRELRKDFELITKGRKSAEISKSNYVKNKDFIFAEETAIIENCSLNASLGPIYIGDDAEIMEGCHIRGPFSLGNHSSLKLGAKVYGATTIGPHCKVGGEVSNVVFQGYANKAHDGFLGNAVIGEWCNIGADSNNSNLKNNYEEVKVWNYGKGGFEKTGLQFCGLFMGDHTKCGINTMFNTGTVTGFSSNIFGSGFPRNFIPSFSWGGAQGMTAYMVEKALETAEKVMQRRGITLQDADKKIFEQVFNLTSQYRNFK